MKSFSNDLVVITASDLKRLFFRHLKLIKKVIVFSALAIFIFLMTRDPRYIAEATFKQAMERSEGGNQIREMFQQMFSQPIVGAGLAAIQSQKVLKRAIEELGMQATCNLESSLVKKLKNIGRNCIAEWGGTLSDPELFIFRNVSYHGEKALQLFLKVTEDGKYQVFDKKKQWLGEAKLKESISCASAHFTLQSIPKTARIDHFYPFYISPLQSMVAGLKKKLTILPLKIEKSILKLSIASSNRFEAAAFLNLVMQSYQEFLKKENDEICQAQVAYLHERQAELTTQFDRALFEHSLYLKENLAKNGFMGFEQEIARLSEPKNLYTSKLFELDLELQRFKTGREVAPQIALKVEELRQQKQLQKISEVKVFHDREPESNDFSGLSLDTAKHLLADYTRERDGLQAQIRELFFLRDQLSRPDFEMSSLGGVFNDNVTNDLVQKASTIALQLKDNDNRSAREQERLHETLQTQKSFLVQYLYQTIEMRKLRGALLDEKIALLREATLNLLQSERILLSAKLKELNAKMADLPEKWHRESLLSFKKEQGSVILQEVSELLETKHLGRHIFQVSSRPLDFAVPPVKPTSPHLLIFTALIAILSGILGYFFLLCKTLLKGMPASDDNLRLSGFPVSGSFSRYCTTKLSQIQEKDLETLRRIAEFLSSQPKQQGARCLNCIAGSYLDYSSPLAELLAMRGLKVLVIHCVFDHIVHPEAKPGLWHYLQNELQELPIRHHLTYDYLPSGGTTRHGAEYLSNPQFATLLSSVKQNYDVVILYSSADAAKAEGQTLLDLADAAVITVQRETKEELTVYCDWSSKKGAECVTFVYAEER